jgi:hypothetical protein
VSQRPHVAAIEALLAADAVLTVFLGESPNNTPPPYVVLYPAMPLVTDEGLCGGATVRTHDFQTTAVGGDVQQAQWVAEHVDVALLGQRPVIAGKSTGLVRKEYTQPARRDDDVEDVFYAVDGWSFTSN